MERGGLAPHQRREGVLWKSDLILSREDRVIVLDVGISWEAPKCLTESFELKRNVYNPPEFLSVLRKKYPNKQRYQESAQTLQISDLVHTTMRGSWYIYDAFMRAVWSWNAIVLLPLATPAERNIFVWVRECTKQSTRSTVARRCNCSCMVVFEAEHPKSVQW